MYFDMSGAVAVVHESDLPRLHSYATRLTGNTEDAKDLVQEALTRYLSVESGQRQALSCAIAWLFVAIKTQWINNARKQRRFVFASPEFVNKELFDLAEDATATQLDASRALDALPDRLWEVVIAHALEGGSTASTAKRLGVSCGTARTRLLDARRKLKRRLDNDDCFA